MLRYSVIAICAGLALAGTAFAADAPATATLANPSPSGMFVAMRDVYLGSDIFPTPIEGLRRLGVDAIELKLGRDFSVNAIDNGEKVFLKSDDDAKAFRERTEKLGIRIWAVLTACDFSAGDPESNIAWVARAIQISDLLGAQAMRIDSAMAKERELDLDARVKIFVDGLSGALKRTEGSKVTLGIENHGFQGNSLEFLLKVFKQVGNDRLGSTLDCGNFYWRGYPLSQVYEILQALAPYAKHTHLKNINYPEDKREIMREAGWEYGTYFCPLEEGNVDLAKVAGILKAAGYKGDLCIEDECVSKCKTPEEKAAIIERDVAHVRKVLAELG